jgi:hypothetical protein
MQRVCAGTAGVDYFNASAEGASDSTVFRGIGAGDTAIGGISADRFGLEGGALAFGGGGGDQFHLAYGAARAAAGIDTIDGGAGTDGLYITINSSQLTTALRRELGRLDDFLQHDAATGAHFVSSLLRLDLTGVETASVRLDGTLRALSAVGIAPTATQLITNGGFEMGDFTGWTNSSFSADPYGYPANFVVTSGFLTPFNNYETPGSALGLFYALADNWGPGAQIISQAFTVPTGTGKLRLSFDLFDNNWSGVNAVNGGLDPSRALDRTAPPNQHIRVEVLDTTTATGPADTDPAHIAASIIVGGGTTAPKTPFAKSWGG